LNTLLFQAMQRIAVSQLQADAFVTLDPNLASAVSGMVIVAPYDDLI
jgi:hypothetical protein